jgi:hypothetical protein
MRGLIIAVSFALITLTGCATNSIKNSCANADWYGMGMQDGVDGEPAEKAAERATDCKSHGATLDVAKYTEGYVVGIQKYCSYKGGKKAGSKGRLYKTGTCPMNLSDEFIRGYQEGREEYEAERALNKTSRY